MTEATIIACGCPRGNGAWRVCLTARPTSEARLKFAQMMLEDQEVADAYLELFRPLTARRAARRRATRYS